MNELIIVNKHNAAPLSHVLFIINAWGELASEVEGSLVLPDRCRLEWYLKIAPYTHGPIWAADCVVKLTNTIIEPHPDGKKITVVPVVVIDNITITQTPDYLWFSQVQAVRPFAKKLLTALTTGKWEEFDYTVARAVQLPLKL